MVSLVPFAGVKNDFIDLLLSREQGGQQDAIVAGMRLRADDFDLEAFAVARENFIDRAHSGHAVADEEETLSLARRQVASSDARRAKLGRCPPGAPPAALD